MAFDLASVVGSAIVSAAVSLSVASWKTGREERAKRRLVAKDRVREEVGEMLASVVKYQAGVGEGRDEGVSEDDADYEWASKVLAACKGLSWLRRRAVRKRLRRLAGPTAFDLAVVKPADGTDGGGLPLFWAGTQSGKYPSGRAPLGYLDEALSKPSASKEVKRLRRELSRLAQCW